MGRKLEFDRDRALRRATELFWQRGYVNTSIAHLQKLLKLGEGSFYNTFKSKKALYLECLQHYNATFMAPRSQALAAEVSARARIEDFFMVVIDDLASRRPAGCLVSNSLNNEVLSQRELKNYLFGAFKSFTAYLADIVGDGQARGEFSAALKPERVARVLFTYLHGLHRLAVYDFDDEARREETQAFLDGVLPQGG